MKKVEGQLFVFSAPSGSGKTTVVAQLLKGEPQVVRSISVTTRPPRRGEVHGRDYCFMGQEAFLRARSRGEFLESARVLDHWYATPRKPIERALAQGKDVLLGIDIQGARQIRKSKLPVTTIFLLPPSFSVLRRRLRKRGTETPAQIRQRLALARREMLEVKRYNYAVVNDRLEGAVKKAQAIFLAERCRIK